MKTSARLTLLLLPLCTIVSSIPIRIDYGNRVYDVWVTKFNTLNATTWHGEPHAVEVAKKEKAERPKHKTMDLERDINATSAHTSVAHSAKTSHTTTSNGAEVSADCDSEPTTNSASAAGSGNNTQPLDLPGTNVTTVSASGNSTDVNSTIISPQYLNGTAWNLTAHSRIEAVANAATAGALSLSFLNKLPSNNVVAYISGLDPNGALIMLGRDGQWTYPTTQSSTPQPIAGNVAIPLPGPNQTLPVTLPGYISSARVWIAEGTLQFFVVATPTGPGLVQPAVPNQDDPNTLVNYAFAELSWGADYGLYADISAVDFVGLPLGIKLQEIGGVTTTIQGTPSDAAPRLCGELKAQAAVDHRAWGQLCRYDASGNLIRVLAPPNLISNKPNAFGTYFAEYVNDVWNHYRTHDLIINTQSTPGNVTCRVQGKQLTCAGDNRGYNKPNNEDIFGCNTGPFAILQGDNAVHLAVVPRLCAAFNRATLLVPGGNVQPSLPPSRYYMNQNRPVNTRPKNWYSELVHKMEVGGRGYAFSYDDVTPDQQEDQSGLVFTTKPQSLQIIIGGV